MDYMTVQQAAEALGMSRRGVQERIDRGEMQAERAGARLWLIPITEVERWKSMGRQKPGPKPGSRRIKSGEGEEAQSWQ
jgi:excisionase family DNA binding protein